MLLLQSYGRKYIKSRRKKKKKEEKKRIEKRVFGHNF